MVIAPGLEKKVIAAQTEVSFVDGENGHLIYRGHFAKDLARVRHFEELAYLLWHGELPDGHEREACFTQWAELREVTGEIKRVIDAIPPSVGMMGVLRTAVSALESGEMSYPPTLDQAAFITMKLPTIIAYRYHKLKGTAPVSPRSDLMHTANYLYMLKGSEAPEAQVKALEVYLNLMMDHGMNSSTFAARVIASTGPTWPLPSRGQSVP